MSFMQLLGVSLQCESHTYSYMTSRDRRDRMKDERSSKPDILWSALHSLIHVCINVKSRKRYSLGFIRESHSPTCNECCVCLDHSVNYSGRTLSGTQCLLAVDVKDGQTRLKALRVSGRGYRLAACTL